MENGTDRPIACASRTLTPAEQKYAQLETERLAVIYGVTQFHQYVLGREFTFFIRLQAVEYAFRETKSVPVMASARVQHWALTLSSYRYHIQYKAGKQQANVDALVHLPLNEVPAANEPDQEERVLMVEVF